MGRITETHVAVYCYCYYANGERWQRNKYTDTSDFESGLEKTRFKFF